MYYYIEKTPEIMNLDDTKTVRYYFKITIYDQNGKFHSRYNPKNGFVGENQQMLDTHLESLKQEVIGYLEQDNLLEQITFFGWDFGWNYNSPLDKTEKTRDMQRFEELEFLHKRIRFQDKISIYDPSFNNAKNLSLVLHDYTKSDHFKIFQSHIVFNSPLISLRLLRQIIANYENHADIKVVIVKEKQTIIYFEYHGSILDQLIEDVLPEYLLNYHQLISTQPKQP